MAQLPLSRWKAFSLEHLMLQHLGGRGSCGTLLTLGVMVLTTAAHHALLYLEGRMHVVRVLTGGCNKSDGLHANQGGGTRLLWYHRDHLQPHIPA
jgi:hypothetical protein